MVRFLEHETIKLRFQDLHACTISQCIAVILIYTIEFNRKDKIKM